LFIPRSWNVSLIFSSSNFIGSGITFTHCVKPSSHALFLILVVNLSALPLSWLWGLLWAAYMIFIMLRCIPLCVFFIMKECCILPKVVSVSIETTVCVFLVLHSVNVMDHTYWLACVKPSLHSIPGLIILMCCWFRFASILLRIFAFIFIRVIGLWFYFFLEFLLFVSG
jgi:hypothetical protein